MDWAFAEASDFLAGPPTWIQGVDDVAVAGRLIRDALREDPGYGSLVVGALIVETAFVALVLVVFGVVCEATAVAGVALSATGLVSLAAFAGAATSMWTPARTWALAFVLTVVAMTSPGWAIAAAIGALLSHICWARFHAEVAYLREREPVSTRAVLGRGRTIAIKEGAHDS